MLLKKISLFFAFSWLLCFFPYHVQAESSKEANNIKTINRAFGPGEKLTYSISWSDLVEAGVASMEVREETGKDGRKFYRLISTARSTGLLKKFYRVEDLIQSIIDPNELFSLSYSLNQRHGKRRKTRDMTFDHVKKTVQVRENGSIAVHETAERVQDALSSLYYVRTRDDFMPEKPIVVDVHDDGKTWSVEVQMLGRERIRTRFGEFNTIKVKTYPKYGGVFQSKGEIFMWLTDDARKIPVLMKSTISIGSVIATLVDLQTGDVQNEITIGNDKTREIH